MISSSRAPIGGLAFYQTTSLRQKRRRERLLLGVGLAGALFAAAVAQQLISPASPPAMASAYAYFNH